MKLTYVDCPYCGCLLSYKEDDVLIDRSVVLTCRRCKKMFAISAGKSTLPDNTEDIANSVSLSQTSSVDGPDVVDEYIQTHQQELEEILHSGDE